MTTYALRGPVAASVAEASSAARAPGGLAELLAPRGAVVLRSAGITSAPALAELAAGLGLSPCHHREPFAPRRPLGGGVWSSPTWPSTAPMCMHHELGWQRRPPPYLLLAALRVAHTGGRTGLADGREVLSRLPARLVEPAERHGWSLVRRYGSGLVGLEWTAAFPGMDRPAVERYAAAEDVALEWGPDRLVTRRTRPALRPTEPDGTPGWCNLLAFCSEWTLDPAVREYLVNVLGRDQLPFETALGDGTPFTRADVELVSSAYDAVTSHVESAVGDVLILDNLRVAHSMEPYAGRREMALLLAAPASDPC